MGTTLLFDRLDDDLRRAHDISLVEYEILVRLSERDGQMRMAALADALAHSRSRVTHTVTRMEKAGLVQRSQLARGRPRHPCDADRQGPRPARNGPHRRTSPAYVRTSWTCPATRTSPPSAGSSTRCPTAWSRPTRRWSSETRVWGWVWACVRGTPSGPRGRDRSRRRRRRVAAHGYAPIALRRPRRGQALLSVATGPVHRPAHTALTPSSRWGAGGGRASARRADARPPPPTYVMTK